MHKVAKQFICEIIYRKNEEISTTNKAIDSSVEDAKNANGAMHSRYDTFLEDAQSLADAQYQRWLVDIEVVKKLQRSLQDRVQLANEIAIGDIFIVENVATLEKRYYMIVCVGAGGFSYESNDFGKIIAVTNEAPVGVFLVAGEDTGMQFPSAKGDWEVIKIIR